MNQEIIKRHAVSATITFLATFAFVFFGLVMQDTYELSKDAILAAFSGASIAGARAVAKIIYELASEFLFSNKK